MIGLKIVRKERNLNQLKVAMDLNISREALSHYENGKREPSLDMLNKMSKYFNVSIDYLINGKEFEKRWKSRAPKSAPLFSIPNIFPIF